MPERYAAICSFESNLASTSSMSAIQASHFLAVTLASAVTRLCSRMTKVTRRRPATWKTEHARAAARVDRLVGRRLRFINPSIAEPLSFRRHTACRLLFVFVSPYDAIDDEFAGQRSVGKCVRCCFVIERPSSLQPQGKRSRWSVLCCFWFLGKLNKADDNHDDATEEQ